MTPDGVYYHTKRLRENGVLIREGENAEEHQEEAIERHRIYF